MLFILPLLFRILWQMYPSEWTCAIFWLVVFGIEVRSIPTAEINWWTRTPILAGACMNATVTLANDGRMPVVGKFHPVSIWVAGTGKNLLFLCDRFWGGFSLGDFFIIGGFIIPGILLLLIWLLLLPFKRRRPCETP